VRSQVEPPVSLHCTVYPVTGGIPGPMGAAQVTNIVVPVTHGTVTVTGAFGTETSQAILMYPKKAHRPNLKNIYKIKHIFFTTTPHHRSIDKVLLLCFKPIHNKFNFISEILKCLSIHSRTILGVRFIKRDGVGSTVTLMRLL
jgi:hypothetical protein